jgi:hypothetical protein
VLPTPTGLTPLKPILQDMLEVNPPINMFALPAPEKAESVNELPDTL